MMEHPLYSVVQENISDGDHMPLLLTPLTETQRVAQIAAAAREAGVTAEVGKKKGKNKPPLLVSVDEQQPTSDTDPLENTSPAFAAVVCEG